MNASNVYIRNMSSGVLMWLSSCGNLLLRFHTSGGFPHMSTLSYMKSIFTRLPTLSYLYYAAYYEVPVANDLKSDNWLGIRPTGRQPICTSSLWDALSELVIDLSWYLVFTVSSSRFYFASNLWPDPSWRMLLFFLSFVQSKLSCSVISAFQSTWKPKGNGKECSIHCCYHTDSCGYWRSPAPVCVFHILVSIQVTECNHQFL